ncbi:histidine phosphatase family protein [Rossellomorea marisflavi]|uniref:histidine phosphatase family protein n=1 Tax=Rossellomorea marisflavi TaxID=189381 RepID=UPI0025AF2A67|nr:histidine phosphatase family protein [Rossellomorea marisflavi]WJV17929.1 histidine phosphatase family protein [Rossellomorea marisflavi]
MIYVIRHGQTDWNKERRMQGRRGLPLNAHGIGQAYSLRDALKGIQFDHVFSSPQEWALQTAEIASGRTAVTDERLNVIDLGEADGVRLEELKRIGPLPDPDVYKGIEDPNALVRRVFHFMNELQATHGSEENILIAGHRCTTGCIGAFFKGMPEDRNILTLSSATGENNTYQFK